MLDAWPLTTLISGLFSKEGTTSRSARERLLDLCQAGGIRLELFQIETLYRALTTASQLITTGPVLAETFHHLERASRDDFGAVLAWTASRFRTLRIEEVDWPQILTHEAATPFGIADASVVALEPFPLGWPG